MGGSADLDLLYGLIYILKPKRLLETGVAYGWSSLAILLAIQNIPDSRLISIDMPYVNRNLDFLVGLAVPDHLQSKWTLLRLADRQGIPKALRRLGDIDFAHYDSDKSSDGRDFAYPIIWNALTPGGVFISDDISDNDYFIDFSERIGVRPLIVRCEDKFAGILFKK